MLNMYLSFVTITLFISTILADGIPPAFPKPTGCSSCGGAARNNTQPMLMPGTKGPIAIPTAAPGSPKNGEITRTVLITTCIPTVITSIVVIKPSDPPTKPLEPPSIPPPPPPPPKPSSGPTTTKPQGPKFTGAANTIGGPTISVVAIAGALAVVFSL